MQKHLTLNQFLLVCFALFFIEIAWGQSPQVKTQRQGNEISFWGQNIWYNHFQIEIRILNPENLADSLPQSPVFHKVIPPQTDSLILFQLRVKDVSVPLRYTLNYAMGNPFKDAVQYDYTYQFPFLHKQRFFVLQGYFGNFSHKKEYALDFKMKEGTQICAARSGRVVWIKKDSDQGGKSSEFAALANRIIIEHNDGTYAYYFHLKYEGVLVKLGEYVNAGQVIGLSGNTGWSTTPHLHFVIKKPVHLGLVSIPTYFLTRPKKRKYPKAWRFYKAYHPR